MNLFIINDLRLDCVNKGRYFEIKAVVDARVEMRCDEHGNVLSKLIMITESKGMSEDSAMRDCIQKLLNHEYYPEPKINMPSCNCLPSNEKLHFDFSNLQEPYKKLFEDLFTDSNWIIPKLITA